MEEHDYKSKLDRVVRCERLMKLRMLLILVAIIAFSSSGLSLSLSRQEAQRSIFLRSTGFQQLAHTFISRLPHSLSA
jgi:hypothetical protein